MPEKLSMKLFRNVNGSIILMMNERPRSSSASFKEKDMAGNEFDSN